MPTKKDYEDIIARVDERTKVLPKIEQHLAQLNGQVSEVTKTAAVNRAIADHARDRAEEACIKSKEAYDRTDKNKKFFYIAFSALAIAIIGGLATIIAQLMTHGI